MSLQTEGGGRAEPEPGRAAADPRPPDGETREEAPRAEIDAPDPLGARIRVLRHRKGLTLRGLADAAGVTESFLSQVERGLASPSISTLRRIAAGLGESIGSLFDDDGEPGVLVRHDARRIIDYPGLGARDEFITPNLDGRLQIILSMIEPGGGTGDEPYVHESDEECVIVLEGSLDLWIGETLYRMEAGDSVIHSSRVPHRNQNNGTGTARVLFILTPPSY